VPVVCDSSPLIALAAINRLSLLSDLFQTVLIPKAVADEIKPSLRQAPEWIKVELMKGAHPEPEFPASLGEGERQAITLALNCGADFVVLDDLPARRVARTLNLPVIGTVGILLASKRRGFIPAIRAEMDSLLQHSFFISADLYDRLLEAAGESRT
jgi:predicted nucleic acid-binding protein